jgi:cell division septum initiation protein DivIVA
VAGERQARDELGRFVAGAGEAADKLRAFSREVDDSARASRERAQAEKEADRVRTERINGALSVGGAAIGQAASAGDIEAGIASTVRAGINAIRGAEIAGVRVGEFAAEASGLNKADRVLGAAGDRTLDVTGDLARYGIEVDSEFRKRTLDIAIEQEKRVEDERAKVSGQAFAPTNVFGIVGEQGDRLLQIVEQILEKLQALGGGGAG